MGLFGWKLGFSKMGGDTCARCGRDTPVVYSPGIGGAMTGQLWCARCIKEYDPRARV